MSAPSFLARDAVAVVAPPRRVAAGITPSPGSTGTLPVWWSAEDWTEKEVTGALLEHRDVCRVHHVDPDTVLKVARGMAEHADAATGRGCRPTNARLVELLQLSLSTVQRARRVLKELRLMAQTTAGRSVMTAPERLAAWRRGSSHRRIAAEFALCSRRERRPALWIKARRRRPAVDRDTPPVGKVVKRESLDRTPHLQRQNRTSEEEAAPRPAPTKGVRRRSGGDPAPRRLAEGARRRLPWLRAVSARRLTPTLTRFARAGWSAYDVERGVADALAINGWRVPPELDQPAAYLARLLRGLDPADRPGALDEWRAAEEAAEATYERQLKWGAPCPHGQPGGDVPSPSRQLLACPHCRAAAR